MKSYNDFYKRWRKWYFAAAVMEVCVIIMHLSRKRYGNAVIVTAALLVLIWCWWNLEKCEKRANDASLKLAHKYVAVVCSECDCPTPLVDATEFPICPKTGEKINGFYCTEFDARK